MSKTDREGFQFVPFSDVTNSFLKLRSLNIDL